MTRKEAREFMMQVLYEMDMNHAFELENAKTYLEKPGLGKQVSYCQSILEHVCETKEAMDQLIDKYSIGWKVERMPKTDIAILRLATCELQHHPDIPTAVSINEAVELAKKYGTDDSPKFVNAILGKVAREVRA